MATTLATFVILLQLLVSCNNQKVINKVHRCTQAITDTPYWKLFSLFEVKLFLELRLLSCPSSNCWFCSQLLQSFSQLLDLSSYKGGQVVCGYNYMLVWQLFR